MTVNNIIYKLTKYFSWLYFRHWERRELLIIVLISLVLLLLIIWQHRKRATRNVYANRIRERSPIIGVKLADTRSYARIEDSRRNRSISLSQKHTKEKKSKEQLEKLKKEIQLLQIEISKHKQNELHLEQQVVELKTANKKLKQKAIAYNQSKQAEKYSMQQIIEVPAIKQTRRQETSKRQKAKQAQTGESPTSIKPSKNNSIKPSEPNWMLREKTEQVRISKELKKEPLDVQKLKAIADLAKKIQGQRRK